MSSLNPPKGDLRKKSKVNIVKTLNDKLLEINQFQLINNNIKDNIWLKHLLLSTMS
jgi:hypothetical protein